MGLVVSSPPCLYCDDVGAGLLALQLMGLSLYIGFHFAQEDDRQAVPRAEMLALDRYASWLLQARLSMWCPILSCVTAVLNRQLEGERCDLWVRLWTAVSRQAPRPN